MCVAVRHLRAFLVAGFGVGDQCVQCARVGFGVQVQQHATNVLGERRHGRCVDHSLDEVCECQYVVESIAMYIVIKRRYIYNCMRAAPNDYEICRID